MKPISATPTEPRHYAGLTAVYGTLAGATALTAHLRQEDPAPPTVGELALYGVATAGMSRVIAREKVGAWLGAPFVDEPPTGEREPRGTGARYAIGELLCCTRCLGSWSALTLVALRAIAPRPARVIATLLALTATNTALQAAIAEIQARSRREESAAEAEGVRAERVRQGVPIAG